MSIKFRLSPPRPPRHLVPQHSPRGSVEELKNCRTRILHLTMFGHVTRVVRHVSSTGCGWRAGTGAAWRWRSGPSSRSPGSASRCSAPPCCYCCSQPEIFFIIYKYFYIKSGQFYISKSRTEWQIQFVLNFANYRQSEASLPRLTCGAARDTTRAN